MAFTDNELSSAFGASMGLNKVEYASTVLLGDLVNALVEFGVREPLQDLEKQHAIVLCQRAVGLARLMFAELKKVEDE